MDKELTENEKEIQEVDSLIDKLSGSAIEFRKSIYDIVFQRLSRFFRTKNKEIAKDTRLKDIFNSNFTEADWEELRNIGLRIPGLQRAKLFEHLTLTYFIAAFVTLVTLAIKNFELVFAVWGLPVLGIIITLTCSPLLLFMMIFKRRYLPCDTIDNLVESIISLNWTELLTDDKSLFKELVREEEDYRRRASAQQCI
jgi:hypothetical protein